MRSLAPMLFLAVVVPICFAQDNHTDVPLASQVIQGSPRSESALGHEENRRLKVDVDLVLVPITVMDRRDRLVLGLERGSFSIFDQNEQQSILHFSSEDAPISLGIIFDTSSSMWGKMERSSQAVVQFLRSANPQDEFFLVEFNRRPELLVDFTSSIDEVQNEISKARPDGTTALLDALYLGLEQMRTARNERKVLLIVSDGGDNHSRYTTKDVWPVLLEAGVQICAMGIFDEAPKTKAERMGPDLLAAITGITGCRTFPIHNLKKIGQAADELASELRNEYLIAYRPNRLVHDGRWHKINVRVTPPRNSPRVRVYAKAGYYAPAQ